jgi:hypothetical protein
LGKNALDSNITGANNVALGYNVSSGDYSNSIIMGRNATATGNNQFVVGSSAYNNGYVGTCPGITAARYWSVIINGVAEKILLQ